MYYCYRLSHSFRLAHLRGLQACYSLTLFSWNSNLLCFGIQDLPIISRIEVVNVMQNFFSNGQLMGRWVARLVPVKGLAESKREEETHWNAGGGLEKNVGPICPSCYNYSWLRYCDVYKQTNKFKTIQQCPMETHDGSNTLCKCMMGVQCSNVPMVSKSGHNRTRMDTIWKSCGFDREVFSYGAVLKKEKLAIFCDNFFLQQFHMAEPTHFPWHHSCKRQN